VPGIHERIVENDVIGQRTANGNGRRVESMQRDNAARIANFQN
jgi:hypothetical protein